jgi:hypothetical protein
LQSQTIWRERRRIHGATIPADVTWAAWRSGVIMAPSFGFASTRQAIMVANKRYQIFVSSTQADLRNEREAIINELTKVGYIAVGMEQFPATDEEQMDFIRPVIDESDYYIVVIKGR